MISLYQQHIDPDYKTLFNLARQKAKRHGLNIEKVEVTSSFGSHNKVETHCGTAIDLADTYEVIDEKVYKQLADKAGSDKINPNMRIYLGYGMRIANFNLQYANASITTGSHCLITNSISFDIKTYLQLDVEAMIHRFAHEMLHEFGYSETDTLIVEQAYYEKIQTLVRPMINNLYCRLPVAEHNLEKRMDEVFSTGSKEKIMLDQLFDKLMTLGCVNLDGATIGVLHPITHKHIDLSFL